MSKQEILYRYRPVNVVQDSKKVEGKDVVYELENREIFLGTLQENNDPMDGLLDVYWEGDEIIWRSFIRHYCLCLMQSFTFIVCVKDAEIFDASCINARATPELLSPKGQELLESITDSLMKDTKIAKLIHTLVISGKVHKDELCSYLTIYHKIIVKTWQNSNKSFHRGLPTVPLLDEFANEDFMLDSQDLDAFPEAIIALDKKARHIISDISNKITEEVSLLAHYNYFYEHQNFSVYKKNFATMLTRFPSIYLDALVASAYDEHYLASFSEKRDDITMWSHYAQGHRGVCLVFNFKKDIYGNFLEAENGEKIYLHKVEYDDNQQKINMFESIGYLSKANLDKYWLTSNGKASSVASAYGDEYHQEYWDGFRRKVSHKFKPWKHEFEHRIVKNAWFYGRQSKEQRIIKYKQCHLVGIIFGFQTDEVIKFKIMNHFDRSLDVESKKTFKFYQARYSATGAKLEIAELSLLKLS